MAKQNKPRKVDVPGSVIRALEEIDNLLEILESLTGEEPQALESPRMNIAHLPLSGRLLTDHVFKRMEQFRARIKATE